MNTARKPRLIKCSACLGKCCPQCDHDGWVYEGSIRNAPQLTLLPAVASKTSEPTPSIPLTIPGLETTVESEIENKVARYLELKEHVKEYHQLRRELKELFESETKVQIGRYTVAPQRLDIPEKAVKSYSQTRLTIY